MTDKAPQKAIISYKEFYSEEYHLDSFDYNILMEAKNSIYDDAIKEGKSKEEATNIANEWWEKVTK